VGVAARGAADAADSRSEGVAGANVAEGLEKERAARLNRDSVGTGDVNRKGGAGCSLVREAEEVGVKAADAGEEYSWARAPRAAARAINDTASRLFIVSSVDHRLRTSLWPMQVFCYG
jgi:hypothetical protein